MIYEDETGRVLGAAMEVLNTLGHGYLEKVYEEALSVELSLRGIPFDQQRRFEIHYHSALVGEYIPDLVVFGRIIVETKTVERIGTVELGQMLNYLKATRCQVGLILNFKRPRLEWQRVALS